MDPIAVKRYIGQVWYDSLAEVVEDFTTGDNAYVNAYSGKRENRLEVYIGSVILYNVRYRDILRAGGAEALYPVLFREAPMLRQETKALRSLERSLDERLPLGNYDIQCLSVDDSFTVHGRVYDGLTDVKAHIEWYMRRNRDPYRANRYHHLPGDVHVLCNYEPYPIFDSSDLGDDRDYCNYFFNNRPYADADFGRISGMPAGGNFDKALESLTCVDELSLLYYPGDGNTMLLVTAK